MGLNFSEQLSIDNKGLTAILPALSLPDNGLSVDTILPNRIPNLTLWLDAADASTITNVAGAVSQWNDKSGNGNNVTQAVGAQQPITGTRTVNGLNGIDFDGSDDNLSVPATAFNYGASTCIYVHFPDVTTNLAVINSNGSGGASTRFFFNNQQIAIGNGARTRPVLTSGSTLVNVARVNKTGSSVQRAIWNNEPELSDSISRLGIGTIFTIGTNGSGLTPYNGIMCEILFWQRELNNAEVNQILSYLKKKWGVIWQNI